MARQVTIICGPPCSGKSTWVRERAAPGDVVVDFDLIAHRLGSRTRYDHSDDIKARVNAEIERTLDDIVESDDVTAWVIRTMPDGADRAALAKRLDAQVVVIRPTLREITRRAEADKRPPWTVQAARKWWERFTPHPEDLDPTGVDQSRQGKHNMADDPTSDTDEGPEPDPEPRNQPAKTASPDKDWAAEADKWKALARKHEKAAADLRPPAETKVEPEEEPEPSRPDNSRRRPQERLRPGAVPDAETEPEETDPRKLAALIPRHPTLG
jgi:5-methylcytosine-specific restriction protein A